MKTRVERVVAVAMTCMGLVASSLLLTSRPASAAGVGPASIQILSEIAIRDREWRLSHVHEAQGESGLRRIEQLEEALRWAQGRQVVLGTVAYFNLTYEQLADYIIQHIVAQVERVFQIPEVYRRLLEVRIHAAILADGLNERLGVKAGLNLAQFVHAVKIASIAEIYVEDVNHERRLVQIPAETTRGIRVMAIPETPGVPQLYTAAHLADLTTNEIAQYMADSGVELPDVARPAIAAGVRAGLRAILEYHATHPLPGEPLPFSARQRQIYQAHMERFLTSEDVRIDIPSERDEPVDLTDLRVLTLSIRPEPGPITLHSALPSVFIIRGVQPGGARVVAQVKADRPLRAYWPYQAGLRFEVTRKQDASANNPGMAIRPVGPIRPFGPSPLPTPGPSAEPAPAPGSQPFQTCVQTADGRWNMPQSCEPK
jgi:hypothetical protein